MQSCPHCDKRPVNLREHIRAVHTKERPFICEQCGKCFVSKGALKEHQVVHNDDFPFLCSQCPKKFKKKRQLKNHIDTHTDNTYVCNICGLKFNTVQTRKKHMVVHSDVTKYKCKQCGKDFKRIRDYKVS